MSSKPVWKRNKYVPALGSFHASDIQTFYNLTGATDWVGADAVSTWLCAFNAVPKYTDHSSVNFACALDPNVPKGGHKPQAPSLLSGLDWPRWTPDCPELLTFEDPNVLTFSSDTFREKAIAYLTYLSNQMGL